MCENEYSMHVITNIQKMMCSDTKAQYRSPWNERLTKISFWLPGTLTVFDVWWIVVKSVRLFALFISSQGGFSQGDSLGHWSAPEVLAWLCFWRGVKVPHSRNPCYCVGSCQSRVRSHKNFQGQEPVDRNDLLTLGTVRWCLHQVEWGQRNHSTCEENLAQGGGQAPGLCMRMALVW